ncbi:MAG: hypothetical protein PHN80_12310 [Hespellia sp.]|nr:hypothetical protein [Hespellia sp.]
MNDVMSPFGMNKYYAQSVLPSGLYGKHKTIVKKTPNIQMENNLLLLIKSGKGKIYVNHEVFRIERGCFVCLGPFHSYSIQPDEGETLEVGETHLNSGAYLYMLSCPYLKANEFLVPQPTSIAKLSEENMVIAEEVMEKLCKTGPKENYHNDKISFLYVLQLFGMMIAEIFEEKTRIKREKEK